MSQKAWLNAYTKGSKALQARIAKVHRNNPEFQDFVKKHGFGGNLSKKQSELQKKGSVQTVKPVTPASPEKNQNMDREALIKAAAEKLRNRRLANANRVAFGGELGGDFSMHRGGFRRYSESVELNELSKDRLKWYVKHALRNMNDLDDMGGNLKKTVNRARNIQKAKRKMVEDIAYKDGTIAMYKGGWIAKRDGKRLGTTMPTDQHAKDLLDATRKSLAQKTMAAIKSKSQEVMKSLAGRRLATESAANRRRIRSWDSAIMPELRPLTVKPKKKEPPFTPDKPKDNPGVVVGRNNPSYSRVRHLARLGLRKAMEQGT